MRPILTLLLLICLPALLPAVEKPRLLFGADLSLVERMEALGVVYRDEKGQAVDPVVHFISRGFDQFRIRLFVNPTNSEGAIQDLPMAIRYATRVKKAGGRLLLDLHYSDTWADPGHQHTPAAWSNLDASALELRVETWTRGVLSAFRSNGTEPDMVQIGNEITPGMLWPLGRNNSPAGWDRLATFLKAGVRGLDRSNGMGPRVVIHIDKGGNARTVQWFYRELNSRQVPFDIIGLSFYPWWHGTLSDLKGALDAARELGKPALVAETAYPYRDAGKFQKESERKNLEFPISPEGQVAYYESLTRILRESPGALGFFVWAPEAIRAKWYGGANALFNPEGQSLPALKAY